MKIPRTQYVQGTKPPRWFGLAYYDCLTDYNICYPIPLNWLVRFGRDLLYFVKKPFFKSAVDMRDKRIFDKGCRKGFHNGYDKGKHDMYMEVQKRVDEYVKEKREKIKSKRRQRNET